MNNLDKIKQDLHDIKQDFLTKIIDVCDIEKLENLKVEYLGQKAIITNMLKAISTIDVMIKKDYGHIVNDLKQFFIENINQKKYELNERIINEKIISETQDITLPTRPEKTGGVHIIPYVTNELIEIFQTMGFIVVDGPEIEDDFHNFSALNIPDNHPAREMQDSFYINGYSSNNELQNLVLRTHTSNTQIRYLEKYGAPCKIIAPGRVYRSDYDQTHTPMFHQIEVLYVDTDVNMSHLKGCVIEFLHRFFDNKELPIRFRNSFFPFTEPSAEVDIGYKKENGEIILGKGKEWLEILGCGMVHPNVLKNVGIDPTKYRGFAIGTGIDRLAMLKYNISDLRSFFEVDSRWSEYYNFPSYY